MPDYTESACDACPRHCRTGAYALTEVTPRVCPTGTRHPGVDWRKTDYQQDARPSFTVSGPPVTAIPAGETVLLGCQGCGTRFPCLREITGPVTERLGCVLGIESPFRFCVWYRAT